MDTQTHAQTPFPPTRDNKLFLERERLNERIQWIVDDCPDPDAQGDSQFGTYEPELGLFASSETRVKRPNSAAGWRAALDPAAAAQLRGFRQGVEHTRKIVMAAGGDTFAGIAGDYDLDELIGAAQWSKAGSVKIPAQAVNDQGQILVKEILPDTETLSPEQATQVAQALIRAALAAGAQSRRQGPLAPPQ